MASAAETTSDGPTEDDLGSIPALLEDWRRSLYAAGKSRATIELYLRHCRYLMDRLQTEQLQPEAINKVTLEAYFSHLRSRQTRRNGRPGNTVKPAYVATQYRSIQQFWSWLDAEGEINDNPFAKMSAPHVEEQPPPVPVTITSKRCSTPALVVRVGGMASIELDSFDFDTDTVEVVLKGGKRLVVPFGSKTSDALRRYRRARAKEPRANRWRAFWLSTRGRGPLTMGGMRQMLERRASAADLSGHANPA